MAPGQGLDGLDLQVVEQQGAGLQHVAADEEDGDDQPGLILMTSQRLLNQPPALIAQKEVPELILPQDGVAHCGNSTAAVR